MSAAPRRGWRSSRRRPAHARSWPSTNSTALPIVEAFLAKTGGHATSACFDVAGPVSGGRAHLTNLPWEIEEAPLAHDLGRVTLLNDL
jgi:glucokinase